MRRSRHQRKAVRVLPVPVGARMRVLSPRAMAGQPWRWGAVGSSKTSRNQEAVTGWKLAKGSGCATSGVGLGLRGTISFSIAQIISPCVLLRAVFDRLGQVREKDSRRRLARLPRTEV